MKRRRNISARREKGQAMVEAALVIPLFIIILVGIIDFGWIYSHQLMINNLSRDGARYAVVHYGESNLTEQVTTHVKGSTSVIDPDQLSVVLTPSGGDIGVTVSTDLPVLTPLTDIFVPGETILITSTTVMSTD